MNYGIFSVKENIWSKKSESSNIISKYKLIVIAKETIVSALEGSTINQGTGILKCDFSPRMLVKNHYALHGTYSILPSSKAQGSSGQILDKIIGSGLVTRKRYSALAQDMLRSHSKSPRWSCDFKTLTLGSITFQWFVVVASSCCAFINT